jgi:hypothetical protein
LLYNYGFNLSASSGEENAVAVGFTGDFVTFCALWLFFTILTYNPIKLFITMNLSSRI